MESACRKVGLRLRRTDPVHDLGANCQGGGCRRAGRVQDVQQIKIGQDGLVMKNGENQGLFLPQVPVEQKWGLQKYLQELCVEKANMPSNCWQDPNTDIFRFTAVVFGEHKQ